MPSPGYEDVKKDHWFEFRTYSRGLCYGSMTAMFALVIAVSAIDRTVPHSCSKPPLDTLNHFLPDQATCRDHFLLNAVRFAWAGIVFSFLSALMLEQRALREEAFNRAMQEFWIKTLFTLAMCGRFFSLYGATGFFIADIDPQFAFWLFWSGPAVIIVAFYFDWRMDAAVKALRKTRK